MTHDLHHDAADDRIERARAALRVTLETLTAAAVRPDALGVLIPERRVLGILPRAERVRPMGEGWRLGALVITTAGDLIVGAVTTRARRPARVGYTAESARERDALRHAAFRGRVPDGATVHVGGRRVDIAARLEGTSVTEPLVLRPDGLAVRWAPGAAAAAAAPLETYLAERADLLIAPPERAG